MKGNWYNKKKHFVATPGYFRRGHCVSGLTTGVNGINTEMEQDNQVPGRAS